MKIHEPRNHYEQPQMQEKVEQKVWYSLYGGDITLRFRLLSETALQFAFAKVKRAKGAPGIDGQTIASFAKDKDQELSLLLRELKDKSYRPLPVRRVVIPKPNGGERKLGIPAVRDRIVQQALLNILQPVYASRRC